MIYKLILISILYERQFSSEIMNLSLKHLKFIKFTRSIIATTVKIYHNAHYDNCKSKKNLQFKN